jgi:PTS system glucose-specific IIA component
VSSVVIAPVAGRMLPLASVPDAVFATEMVGSGVAVEPADEAVMTAIAPVTGRLVKLHPHAYVILRTDGAGVLVHLGIDTVKLNGAGFELHVQEGAVVSAGQPVITFSPREIRARGLSAIVPVVVMDSAKNAVTAGAEKAVGAGDHLYDWPPVV